MGTSFLDFLREREREGTLNESQRRLLADLNAQSPPTPTPTAPQSSPVSRGIGAAASQNPIISALRFGEDVFDFFNPFVYTTPTEPLTRQVGTERDVSSRTGFSEADIAEQRRLGVLPREPGTVYEQTEGRGLSGMNPIRRVQAFQEQPVSRQILASAVTAPLPVIPGAGLAAKVGAKGLRAAGLIQKTARASEPVLDAATIALKRAEAAENIQRDYRLARFANNPEAVEVPVKLTKGQVTAQREPLWKGIDGQVVPEAPVQVPEIPTSLPSGRVAGGSRAVPLGDIATPPREVLPPVESATQSLSGRSAGGIQNIRYGDEKTVLDRVDVALTPAAKDPIVQRVVNGLPKWFSDRTHILSQLQNDTNIPVHARAQVVPGYRAWGEAVYNRHYAPVLDRVKGLENDLERYMVFKRVEDLAQLAQKRAETGVGKVITKFPGGLKGMGDALNGEEALRLKLGDEAYATITQTADELYKLHDDVVLKPMLQDGLLSQELYDYLKVTHPHYIPWRRAGFAEAAFDSISDGRANLSNIPMQQLADEGVEAALDSPLEHLIQQVFISRAAIMKNRAAKAMVEALDISGKKHGESLLEWVEPAGEFRRAANVTGEVLPPLAKAKHSDAWEAVSFFSEGKKYTVNVPRPFGEVAKGLGMEPDGPVLAVARAITAPLRLGATTYYPFFLPVNALRDASAAMFREKVFPFGPDWIAGLWGAIFKNDDYYDTAKIGGLNSGLMEVMKTTQTPQARLGEIRVKSAADILLFPFKKLEAAQIAVERAPRIAVNRQLKREGLSELERSVRIRDVSVDFSKSGTVLRVVNQIFPFTNAAVQGSLIMARTMREHPTRSLAFAALYAVPTFITRINNMRFETSELIPDYLYTRNWVIQWGEGTRKDGSKFPLYFTIPKGEIAGLLTFPVEAMFHTARNSEDRSAVEVFLDAGIEQARNLSPVDPSLALPIPGVSTAYGLAANQNFFTGAPIVPQGEQSLPAGEQFDDNTSEIAVALGRAFKVSPRKIDFAIRDYTAGLGESSNWMLSQAIQAVGYDPQPLGSALEEPVTTAENIGSIPGVKRFFGTRDSQVVRRGYERLNEAVEYTNARWFQTVPLVHEYGIKLGTAGDSISGVELTPKQRAEYQVVMAEYVIPRMAEYAKEQSERPLTSKSLIESLLRRRLTMLKGEAARVFGLQITKVATP